MQSKAVTTRLVFAGVAVVCVILVIVLPVTLVHDSNSTSNIPSPPSVPVSLITFNADAYTDEVVSLLIGFNSSQGVSTAPPHAAGSFGLAKQIETAGCKVDVFLPVALSAAAPSNLGNCSAQWAISFVSDEMVLAYARGNSTTAAAPVIALFRQALASNTSADWNSAFSNLTGGSVKVGIANAAVDPAGLRGWLVLEAAGFFYAGGQPSAYVDRILSSGANVSGPAAESMITPLEAGVFQFLFIYRSAATDAGLPFLVLDRLVNLGDPALAQTYSQFQYTLPSGVNHGGPIMLSITIPTAAPHPTEAESFVKYVVSIYTNLSSFGVKPISPPRLYNNTRAPLFVSAMLEQATIVAGGLLGP